VSHAFSSLDELGDGPGFRKIRAALGVTAFGVNARELGEGGLFHVESTTPRTISNPFEEDAVVFVVGAKGGYVERDGHLTDPERDAERRASFGKA
jgi:hypothetical protein